MQSDVMSVQYAQGTQVLTITSNRNFENQAKFFVLLLIKRRAFFGTPSVSLSILKVK